MVDSFVGTEALREEIAAASHHHAQMESMAEVERLSQHQQVTNSHQDFQIQIPDFKTKTWGISVDIVDLKNIQLLSARREEKFVEFAVKYSDRRSSLLVDYCAFDGVK